jgi:hypothetical protein
MGVGTRCARTPAVRVPFPSPVGPDLGTGGSGSFLHEVCGSPNDCSGWGNGDPFLWILLPRPVVIWVAAVAQVWTLPNPRDPVNHRHHRRAPRSHPIKVREVRVLAASPTRTRTADGGFRSWSVLPCAETAHFGQANNAYRSGLAFHRASRQAFHVIPLQEQVEDDGRETPDEGGGGQHGPLDEPSPVEMSS